MQSVDALQQKLGTQASVERARQTLFDELAKQRMDVDAVQRSLSEGI